MDIERTLKAAKQMTFGKRKTTPGNSMKFRPIPAEYYKEVPKEEQMTPGELNLEHVRTLQVNALNNVLQQRWKKQGKRTVAPKLEFCERPAYPYRDRIMLCGDCERRNDYRKEGPIEGCSCSTLVELDMTAPWSRDNVMAVSCEMAQMIREDVWALRDEKGQMSKVQGERKVEGSFPLQVCMVCRKTSLAENRRFRMCATCEGVSYCSDECYAQDRMRHRAHCTLPYLPHRQEWGIRKKLRSMRGEIYPMMKMWRIKDPGEHRIAWLPKPRRTGLLQGEKAIKPCLPGFQKEQFILPTPAANDVKVKDGRVAIVAQPRRVLLRQPRKAREADPDPYQLMTLGMTREEYLRKDAELWAEAAAEDEELKMLSAAQVAALRAPPAAPPARPVVRLSEDAVNRLDHAALNAPKERVRPPWELLEEQNRAGDTERVVAEGRAKRAAAAAQRKPGVVPVESPVETAAKAKGLRLSPEAIDRLEAVLASIQSAKHPSTPQGPPPVNEWTKEDKPPQRDYLL